MPAPVASLLSMTAKRHFAGLGIQLPVAWSDMGPLYPQAFSPAERVTPGNPSGTLFREPTANHYHTEAARVVGRGLSQFIDEISAAIAAAIGQWMRTASVVSVAINGPVGMVSPGGITGPSLTPLILAKAPQRTEMETLYSRAVARAVADGWARWQQGLSGTLHYPSFAAAPAPMAPPTPNAPAPLVTFASAGEGALAPAALKQAMSAALGGDGQHAGALFDALANAFYNHFQTFKTSTQVSGVIGTGPVSMMPSGPVAGGSAIPVPGNFV